MFRLAGPLLVLALTLAGSEPTVALQATRAPLERSGALVYHQITALEEDGGGVGQPVLSGDGTTAVFARISGSPEDTGDSNRIFVIQADGSGLSEVDAYTPNCGCGTWVDISADGATVVSSDSMQVRLVAGGGTARTLVDLSSNEMSSIRLTANGDRVFFLLARDTQVADATDILQRGIYAVDTGGDEIRQIVGPEAIAQLLGLTPDEIQMLRLQTNALDISADGSRIVFGAYTGAQQAVFAANGDGSGLHEVLRPVSFVQRVAISGDGALIAHDVIPPEPPSGDNEISVVPFGGGKPEILATGTGSGFDDPLQLSGDGSQLLVSPNAYLIDTATGVTRQLAVLTPGARNHTELLIDGMARATMDTEATRFLYVMRTTRCADCPNLQEQLATLDIDAADSNDAPAISDGTIEPTRISMNAASAATATARIDGTGVAIATGVVALRDGVYDVNVGRDALLHDDGQDGDGTASDGIFTNTAIVHIGVIARDDDTGPRALRVQAEYEASDGLRHATAIDTGTLTVIEGP